LLWIRRLRFKTAALGASKLAPPASYPAGKQLHGRREFDWK